MKTPKADRWAQLCKREALLRRNLNYTITSIERRDYIAELRQIDNAKRELATTLDIRKVNLA